MIRIFDFLFSFFGLFFLWPILLVVYIIGLFDTGSPIFIQERVGRFKKPFKLMKFRTMPVNTKSVATHLSQNVSITKFGSFLRKSKLDELPQLINVLIGDMSLVGPRPNLFNQIELIEERDKRGVYEAVPGITGLAQINEIDMSTPVELAEKDAEMLKKLKVSDYFSYIFSTIGGKGQGDRIKK
ncbi:putative sugar transferase EpsL [Chryseobacterium aquaeductus]|uniref:Sugar transferase EpsL n=1 Tax=Chryseobacterium aquaeductus TaxID=2675056 RepID=A0A9N8MIX2_9FLAO|nr:sugar transferase [Chryseobacterium aquaeductus]CAA7331611.1 putative sugar transferase EpsL [Chryseobacterium potabilaquae]CAD7811242.1 putative sugar transferase EpsL [Chryseobacterium aquaeductus]